MRREFAAIAAKLLQWKFDFYMKNDLEHYCLTFNFNNSSML
jgi:hypothetical protein